MIAIEIAKLAFQTLVESIAGELTSKLMDTLRDKIWTKLKGKPEAEKALMAAEKGSTSDLDKVAEYLQAAMSEDPKFAQEVNQLAAEINAGTHINAGTQIDRSKMIQKDFHHSKGYQIEVNGGTVNIG